MRWIPRFVSVEASEWRLVEYNDGERWCRIAAIESISTLDSVSNRKATVSDAALTRLISHTYSKFA